MSPRGVYDRSKAKKNTAKNAKTSRAKGETQTRKTRKTKASDKAEKSNVVAHPSAGINDQFAILRDNISALGAVRAALSEVDEVSMRVEAEIIAEVDTLSQLRKRVFGLTDAEKAQQEQAAQANANQSGSVAYRTAPEDEDEEETTVVPTSQPVPLPNNLNLPTPPHQA